MVNNGDRVTLRDIYDRFDRLEDKMDIKFARIETRVDVLEDFKSRAYGVIAILSVFVTGFFTWLWKRITGE